LRVLAECDASCDAESRLQEEKLRDDALVALVRRDYAEAHTTTCELAARARRAQRVEALRESLREECDRVSAATSILDERKQILKVAPAGIQDPLPESIGEVLKKRHDVTLRLLAAVDERLQIASDGSNEAAVLQQRRARLSMELDLMLAACAAHDEKSCQLNSASDVLGDGTPDTASYLRRCLAYLEARSNIVLQMVAFIDERLLAISNDSPTSVTTDDSIVVHLRARRAELVVELDRLNAQTDAQKRGEAELRACGLTSSPDFDPYHAKVCSFLESRSEMSLQLLAFIDGKLSRETADSERNELTHKRDVLRREADAALEALDDQRQGQLLLESLGLAAGGLHSLDLAPN